MPKWTKEQLEAIEKDGSNIIVSAGAGSGKTAVLSERVIYKLTHGIHIDELLILTFTRAAAEEMKDRIRKKIEKDPTLKNELDALDSSYITTFDSFALSVVKKYHYLLNIKKDIDITDESIVKLKKKKALDKIFNKKYKDREDKFVKFVTNYSLKNDRELKRRIMELIDKIDGYLDREGFFKYIKDDFYSEENIDQIVTKYKKYIEEKKHALSLELTRANDYFDQEYIEKLNRVILPILNTNSLDELWSITDIKLPTLKRGTDEDGKNAKENIKIALSELMSLKEFGNEEKIKNDILSTRDTVNTIIDIIEDYYKVINEFKSTNDIYTFQDIAMLSIEILEKFPEARLELKNKFKEIMIDEYQDTNDIQEKFISLIQSNNVYMVGDIKQSIYRFRGSNPDIFKDKYDRYSKGIDGYKIDLIKNFRSREEVLDNINRIFDLIMDDTLGGAAYTVSHEMVFGNLDYVEKRNENSNYNLEVLEYDECEDGTYTNYEIEIFSIIKDLKDKASSNYQVYDKKTGLLRPFKYSDAVIILDRSKYFDTYKKIFEYMNIPLTILKDDKLNTSIDMYLIKNLIDLVIRINDGDLKDEFKYSFMSIGRSFLYEYTDEYLFEVITNNRYKDTSLYKDIESIESVNSKSIEEILLELLDITEFYDKIYKIGDYENINIRINKLIELAENLGNMGYSIVEFRDYLENIIEEDREIKYTAFTDDVDSVKIMSIHKSKGLEYPVCYFADLTHAFNTMELKSKFIVDSNYGLIVPVSLDNTDSDSVLKTLYKNNFMKEEISEKIRLFYVALTRAREKMIILLPYKDTIKLEKNRDGVIDENRRLKFKSLGDFIYGIKEYHSNYFKKIDINDLNLSKEYLYNRKINNDQTDIVNKQFQVEDISIPYELKKKKIFSKSTKELLSEDSIKNMEFGTKIHEILEYIDFKNFIPASIEDEFIRNKVTNFINSDLLKNVASANIYHEYEFIYEKDDTTYHGSIDLMLEYNDHIDIIDYKLKNTTDEHYLDQLLGYKNYIEEISNKKVFTYLYSIIDGTFTKLN